MSQRIGGYFIPVGLPSLKTNISYKASYLRKPRKEFPLGPTEKDWLHCYFDKLNDVIAFNQRMFDEDRDCVVYEVATQERAMIPEVMKS